LEHFDWSLNSKKNKIKSDINNVKNEEINVINLLLEQDDDDFCG